MVVLPEVLLIANQAGYIVCLGLSGGLFVTQSLIDGDASGLVVRGLFRLCHHDIASLAHILLLCKTACANEHQSCQNYGLFHIIFNF